MVDLGVKIGKLKLKNPVMVASGTFGIEYVDLMDINALGAYVAKTITLRPRIGNPPPRVTETPSGMLNSIGLENKGVEDFIKNKLPLVTGKVRIPIIVSIAGDDEDEFRSLAKRLDGVNRISALELNMSCPNVKHGEKEGLIAQDAGAVYDIVNKVRQVTRLTIIAKLSPCVTDIAKIAQAAERAGADAVSLINTFPAMAVDIYSMKAVLGNITGGLSGPAIKPISLKMIRDTYKKINIPVVGIGGITTYEDAVEFMLCGAAAVQVGTSNFVNPKSPIEIIEGLKRYLAKNKIKNAGALVGGLKV